MTTPRRPLGTGPTPAGAPAPAGARRLPAELADLEHDQEPAAVAPPPTNRRQLGAGPRLTPRPAD